MATLSTHLRRWSRTYGFRITLLYVALFGVSILILFGVIYWITAEFMEAQLRAAIATELSSLVDDYGSSGIDSTVDAITRRVGSREHEASYYLLQDAAGTRFPAIFRPWPRPPLVRAADPAQPGDDTDSSDTLMAQGQALSNGWFSWSGRTPTSSRTSRT